MAQMNPLRQRMIEHLKICNLSLEIQRPTCITCRRSASILADRKEQRPFMLEFEVRDRWAEFTTLGRHAESGIKHLRFYDLRGTAATNFARTGLTVDHIAFILAWEKHKVEQVVVRYVTGNAIGKGIVEHLRQNKARTEAVKRGCKPGRRGRNCR